MIELWEVRDYIGRAMLNKFSRTNIGGCADGYLAAAEEIVDFIDEIVNEQTEKKGT